MPLFEYLCMDCGKSFEMLVTGAEAVPPCGSCGGRNLKKLLSAHSPISGTSKTRFPGPGDTACCGSNPTQANCAGPSSCCGKH